MGVKLLHRYTRVSVYDIGIKVYLEEASQGSLELHRFEQMLDMM